MKRGCDDFCYIIDNDTVDDVIYALKFKISALSADMLNQLVWGFGCSPAEKLKLTKLNAYKEALERVWKAQYYKTTPCLTEENINDLIESAKNYINLACCENGRLDCVIDTSDEEAYALENPQCQSYDSWNKWTKFWCGEIGLTIELEERACEIMFNIAKDIIPCNVLFALQVKKELCDLGFEVSRSEEECKIDWELLLHNTECNIEFDTYRHLVSCGFSYDIIKSVIDAGCAIEVIGEGECDINLVTITGKFNICEVTPENLTSVEKFGEKITVTKEQLSSDYKKIGGTSPL